jgi:hypothetical protein
VRFPTPRGAGKGERAHPGRNGQPWWRFTHNGVVYITDETKRHEVTSWRLDGGDDDAADAPVGLYYGCSSCTS